MSSNAHLMMKYALRHNRESGQAAVCLLLMLSLFLLGTLALAIDFSNIWFHRQAEQAASDAACQAGAMDLLANAAGISLPKMGFTPGSASDCRGSSGATMCTYASANGYDGRGLMPSAASNSVSWIFPSSVPGVTSVEGSVSDHPYLTVSIDENVRTYFVSLLHLSAYQSVHVQSTCGLVGVKSAPAMIILHPTMSGALTYNGGSNLTVMGGPSRGLQVNSSSATAVSWQASGLVDLSLGGANQTGSDMAVVGGPSANPTNGSSSGFKGGTTGAWRSGVLPIGDPFGALAAPVSVKALVPANGTSGKWVQYGVDGCPDQRHAHWPKSNDCMEFSPGYYPSGLKLPDNWSTSIFLPGIYYLNGSLDSTGSNVLRVAKPPGHQQTDGIMLYFLTGSLNLAGGVASGVDAAPSSDLTCDGSSPPGVASSISGNLLIAQCTSKGTYWDTGGDTSDVRGNPGSRGLLIYQDHSNTTSPQFSGAGALTFTGALYFHSTGYQDVLNLNNGGSSATYVLGEIVVDQLRLSGSGTIKLGLNSAPSNNMVKAAMLQ